MDGLKLQDHIQEIVEWFTGLYRSPDGFPYYELDGLTGKPIGSRTLLAELGDYLPFMVHCGATAYVAEQTKLFAERLALRVPLFARPVSRTQRGLRLKLPGGFIPRYTDFLDYTEILYGLCETWDATGNNHYLDLARTTLEQVLTLFHGNGVVYSWYLPLVKRALPLTESLSGMIIEALVDLHRATGSERYLQIATEIGRYWLNSSFFKQYQIFPSALIPNRLLSNLPKLRAVGKRAELCKANTSMVWGLLALYRQTKDAQWLNALNQWIEGLKSRFGAGNGVFYQLGDLSSHPSTNRPILSTNFALLDLFCELYWLTKGPSYLEMAIALGDYWLARQSLTTGLFPDEIGKAVSYIDGNTDFIIALQKLTELSGEERYLEAARKALRGILTYHRGPFGYAREVDLETGTVINPLVETRFVSLFLKVLLVFAHQWTVFGENGKLDLLRDR